MRMQRFSVSLAVLLAGAFAPVAGAGTMVITNVPNGADATATDANTGISPLIPYTHLVDLATDDGGAVINGVTFAGGASTGTGGGTVGTYSLVNAIAGAPSAFQNHNAPATDGSGLDDLLDDFFHTGGQTTGAASLTLSGLTPGVPYKLRLFVGGFGGNLVTFTADDSTPVTTTAALPRNGGDDAIARSFDYTYTLPAGDTTFGISATPATANDSFHWYGFSNEVVPEPGSAALLGVGAAGAWVRRRRRSH